MKSEHPSVTQPVIYRRLVEAIAEDSTIAIIGAGSSRRCGYPSWKELLEGLCEEAGKIEHSTILKPLVAADPYLCADKIKKILTPKRFYSRLVEIFGPEEPACDSFHKALVALPFKHFFTTNYDRILQVAYAECINKPYVELDLSTQKETSALLDAISSRSATRHFVHVHGYIKNPQGMILAKEDFDSNYSQRNDIVEILKYTFARRVVFFGFSLQDDEFLGPLKFLTSCFGNSNADPKHFAILPKTGNADEEVRREICRSKYRIEPLFYEIDDGHTELVPLLTQLRTDVKKRHLEYAAECISYLESVQPTEELPSVSQAVTNLKMFLGYTVSASNYDAMLFDKEANTGLDKEITGIFSYVTNGKPDVAIEMCKGILAREKGNLSARLLYRLHANIGNALLTMRKLFLASEQYLEATKHWSDTKEAKALRALGCILAGRLEEAHNITQNLIREHSDYPRAYAMHLQSLSGECNFSDARRLVPFKLRRDPEIAYTLAIIASRYGLIKRCETYSRVAWRLAPDWVDAGLTYATSLILSERENAIICGGTKLIPRNIDRIKQADRILTTYVEKLQVADPGNLRGIFLYNRATTRRMLGQENEARADIEQAFTYDRTNPNIIGAYALQREQDISREESIRILEQQTITPKDPNLSFLLANMLFQRSLHNDTEKALTLLLTWVERIKEVLPEAHRYDHLRLTAEIYIKIGKTEELLTLLTKIPEEYVSGDLRQLVIVRMQVETGAITKVQAREQVEHLAKRLWPKSNYYVRRELALLADKIELYSLSCKIWKEITSSQEFSEDSKCLIRSAQKAQKHELIIEYCSELRRNNIRIKSCYICEIEANIAFREFNQTLNLMVEWLTYQPDDREVRMHLSLLASDLGREEYVEKDPTRLPTIEETSYPEYGIRVSSALKLTNNSSVIIEFAYALWRKFPDNMNVRHHLIFTVIDNEKKKKPQSDSVEINIGDAVVYKALETGQTHLHIIEAGPNPSISKNEYAPDNEISRLLLARRVADTILVDGREWLITEVHNKYSYIASKLLQNFCVEHPGNALLKEFHLAPGVKPQDDLQVALHEVRTFMQEEEEQSKAINGLYQSGLIPVVTFAQGVGKSVFETMLHLASSRNHRLRVRNVINREFTEALGRLQTGCKLVLDETVAATIFMLKLHQKLNELPYQLIVPESLLYEIQLLIQNAISNKENDLYLGISGGNLHVQRLSPTERAEWITALEDLLSALRNHCSVEGGKATMSFEPDARAKIVNRFGAVSADAIAIAKAKGAIYWTDDLNLSATSVKLRVPSIWSQVALLYAANQNKHFLDDYKEAVKKMFLWGYDFTVVNVELLISMFGDAKWNRNDYRFTRIMEFISEVGVDNIVNCISSCCLVIGVWQKCPNKKFAREILIELLDRIGHAKAGPLIARRIYRCPRKLPIELRDLKQMLRAWRCKQVKQLTITRTV